MLGLLPSIASTLTYNLGYSGLAGSVWGWITAGILIQSVVFGMAELCPSMPTAGGLYYASAVLAPEGWGPLASWVGTLKILQYKHSELTNDFLDCGMVQFPRYRVMVSNTLESILNSSSRICHRAMLRQLRFGVDATRGCRDNSP